MWKSWEPAEPVKPDGGYGLGEECGAVLAGTWAEYRAARGEDVPHWAWLNQVAHASEKALRIMTRLPAWSHREMDEWARLRACVAESLLKRAAENAMTAADLQRTVLVPIELALFGDETVPRQGDAQLLIRILAALRHPSAQPGTR